MLNRKPVRLLALTLALLLLAGCVGPAPTVLPTFPPAATAAPASTQAPATEPARTEAPATETETPTEAPTEAPTEPLDEALTRWQNAGQKDYLPREPVAMVPFSQMEYVRPDVERLYTDFDALTAAAEGNDDAEALLEGYYDLYTRYISFYSMDALANVLYSLDTTDPYYQEEYDFCEAEAPNLEEKLEALQKAFAASPARKEMEERYFGPNYFDQYDDYEVYTNPEYLRLSQEEAALLSQYRELTAEMPVTYRGQTRTIDEWMEMDLDYDAYIDVLRAYYETYNPRLGELFIQLVKVRRELAAALDYESYAAYSYDMVYGRDYSPQEGDAFLEGIRTHLVPVMELADTSMALYLLDPGTATETQIRAMLASAAENIGGTVWDAYRFMTEYQLSDVGRSAKKVDASFQTYLYDYEAPFVFLNAQGTGEDYSSFAHEFGHFTDSYYNYGAGEDLETAETFSQAMEFLALTYADTLNSRRQETLIKLKLLDLLETFVYQGSYADFEAQVYALAPEELTLDRINAIFLQCTRDYGIYQDYSMYDQSLDFYYALSWVDVLHFYEVPYYIVSYCVSAETALQVYRLETRDSGAGVEAYFRLLDRDYNAGVQQVMADADLSSPFREETLEEIAAFFVEELELK